MQTLSYLQNLTLKQNVFCLFIGFLALCLIANFYILPKYFTLQRSLMQLDEAKNELILLKQKYLNEVNLNDKSLIKNLSDNNKNNDLISLIFNAQTNLKILKLEHDKKENDLFIKVSVVGEYFDLFLFFERIFKNQSLKKLTYFSITHNETKLKLDIEVVANEN